MEIEYYIFWSAENGEEGMSDEPFESREEALAEIEKMKAEDAENGEGGVWEYRVEEREPDDGENEKQEYECGDYPDSRSVVCAGGRVRSFRTSYDREMWEIGMRESDFC